MKRFLQCCVVALACLGLGAGAASACEMYEAIGFQVDFGFQLGGQTFPPGGYTIERTDLQDGQPLRIVKAGMNGGETFNTSDIEAEEVPTSHHVVFSVLDGKHVLTEIWMDSKKVGCQVIQEHEHTDKHKKKKAKGDKKKHSSESD